MRKSFPENMGWVRAKHGRFGSGSVDRRWLILPSCADWQTRQKRLLLRAHRRKLCELIGGNASRPLLPSMTRPTAAGRMWIVKPLQTRRGERSMELASEPIANTISFCPSYCAQLIRREKKRLPHCPTCKYRGRLAETRFHLSRSHATSVWDGRIRCFGV